MAGDGLFLSGGGASDVGGMGGGHVVHQDFGPHGLFGCDEQEGVGG